MEDIKPNSDPEREHGLPDRESESQRRAAVYGLTGRLWLTEVDQSFLDMLDSDADFKQAITEVGCDLSELTNKSTVLARLAEDFCQLFLGPSNHLPPYQSVWIDGHFAGQHSVDMRKWCEIAHVNVDPSTIEADQLGVQLTVMARIVEAEQRDAEEHFFRHHLSWTRPLTQLASERASTAFYGSIAKVTAAYLESEAKHFARSANVN
jgi:TorA maturation chaperone TorD